MRFGVQPSTLPLLAGILWIAAGINILRIGLIAWTNDPHPEWVKAAGAILTYCLFAQFIFNRLLRKHMERIAQKRGSRCPFSFFDAKGWSVMGLMITMGVALHHLHLLSDCVTALFYTGLSLALIRTGIRFLRYWWRMRTEETKEE